jgi:phosphoribosylcarboxyaminoimidazole (NCAIR) mutase
MSREYSSISRFGLTEPFNLQVARGQIAYHYSVFKFGFNPDVDDALETVWAEGGLYSYLSAATVLKVSSSSADDTSAGTGARTVELQGLDGDYNQISETVTLNGQTAVNTTKSFLRIYRMIVKTAGTGAQNAGVIYAGTGTVTIGVPANKYATISVGDNQTLMALWTVPAGHTAYILQTDITVATTQNNKYCTARLVARPDGEVFQVKDKFAKSEGSHHQQYDIPLKFEEKTDIEVRAIGDSSGADIAISAGLDIIYIKNVE